MYFSGGGLGAERVCVMVVSDSERRVGVLARGAFHGDEGPGQ